MQWILVPTVSTPVRATHVRPDGIDTLVLTLWMFGFDGIDARLDAWMFFVLMKQMPASNRVETDS